MAEIADDAGSEILYRDAQGAERAFTDVEAQRLLGIPAELIQEQWDPRKVQVRNIPVHAYNLGVIYWEGDWNEGQKRQWLSQDWTWKAYRGTSQAEIMALGINGYEQIQEINPPQGFFISEDMSAEEYQEWLKLLPQLRIYAGSAVGTSGLDEMFLGEDEAPGLEGGSYIGVDFIGFNDAPILSGRRMVLRFHGQDIPLQVGFVKETFTDGTTRETVTTSTIGESPLAFFIDDSFIGEDDERNIIAAEDAVEPKIYTFYRDVDWRLHGEEASISILSPTLTPVSLRYEWDSDTRDGGPYLYIGEDFEVTETDDAFIGEDEGDQMLAERIYLLDPDVLAPMTAGWSYIGVDRLGFPSYTSHVLIDLKTTDVVDFFYIEASYIDHAFITADDFAHCDRAYRAVSASKALRDSVYVSFAVRRLITPSDVATEAMVAGEWVPNFL